MIDSPASRQHRLGEMFAGKWASDWMWNVVDVRDTADAQRRMAESPLAKNGSRCVSVRCLLCIMPHA